MDKFTWKEIKAVVFNLMKEEKLQNKIFVAGGSVPWLISGKDSGRKHGDIDIVVEKKNMDLIREYLKAQGLYQQQLDSMFLNINLNNDDYGVEAFINKISVNFAPFEQSGNDITQKNFSVITLAGFDALMKVTLKDISIDDYVTFYKLADGIKISSYSLEAVKASKENSDREKDVTDLQEIEKIGINKERYERVKPAIQNMALDIIPDKQH